MDGVSHYYPTSGNNKLFFDLLWWGGGGGTSGSVMLLLLVCCRLFREFFLFPPCLLLVLEIPLETFLKHFLTNIIQATSNNSQQVSKLAPINKLNVPPTSQSKSMVPYPRSSRIYSYSRFWNKNLKNTQWWAVKFKKVQTKKNSWNEINQFHELFMTKCHFLPFQKWPKINFWTGKSLKLPKMQFHKKILLAY